MPPGVKIMSAFESELIMLSLKFKLSTSRVPTASPSRSNAPDTVRSPVMSTLSARVIFDESDELKVVPFTVNDSSTTFPVPFPDMVTSELVVMLVTAEFVIVKLSISMAPVPLA